MKRFAVAIALMLLCVSMTAASEVTFVDTYDEALQLAAEKDLKVLITFKTDA